MAVLVHESGAVLMSDLLRQTCQVVQAFDESSTFMGGVKTLESFEGLLERPAVAVVVRKCGAVLMSDLTLDLRRVRTCPYFLCVIVHCMNIFVFTALAYSSAVAVVVHSVALS